MAMTSASFMGIGYYVTTFLSKLDKIDCSQVLSAVLKADKELLGHIKMGPAAENIDVFWIEDALVGCTFEGHTSVSTSIALIGISTSAIADATFRAKMIVQKVGSEIYYRVDALDGTSALETTIYASGTHVTESTTATWIIVAAPYSDIDSASNDISQLRAKRRNFTQVFERAVEITQSRKAVSMEAISSELQHQIKLRTLEIKRELDISAINGMAFWDTTKNPNTEWRTMAGFINLIRDPEQDNTPSDALVTDVDAALTQTVLNTLCYDIWNAGGFDEQSDPIIVVGASQQRIIAAWEKDLRRVEQGERQVGYYRDVFLSDMGKELPVVLDRWMPSDKLMILDRSRISLRALQGDAWHMEKMAKSGRSEKWQISGQYTVELRNADKCHGLLYDLS